MEEIIKINDSTWRIEDGHVRFFLFCGTDRAALIDSGMNTPHARKIAEDLTDLPLILINTHADADHIAGNGAFGQFCMSPAEEECYRNNNGKGKLIPVTEGDVIDLGGRPLRVIDIPGHTPGSIALLDETNRVLVSGDTVQDGTIFMFGGHRDLDSYIKSLRHLLEFDGQFDLIYPMHGTFPVSPDLTAKLLEGAMQIRSGEAKGELVKVFGRDVLQYNFPYAGFYCELPEEQRKRAPGGKLSAKEKDELRREMMDAIRSGSAWFCTGKTDYIKIGYIGEDDCYCARECFVKKSGGAGAGRTLEGGAYTFGTDWFDINFHGRYIDIYVDPGTFRRWNVRYDPASGTSYEVPDNRKAQAERVFRFCRQADEEAIAGVKAPYIISHANFADIIPLTE